MEKYPRLISFSNNSRATGVPGRLKLNARPQVQERACVFDCMCVDMTGLRIAFVRFLRSRFRERKLNRGTKRKKLGRRWGVILNGAPSHLSFPSTFCSKWVLETRRLAFHPLTLSTCYAVNVPAYITTIFTPDKRKCVYLQLRYFMARSVINNNVMHYIHLSATIWIYFWNSSPWFC